MFVVFEGIDGSGKTTLSGVVADELAKLGITVYQARPKGELRSRLAGQIRELARNPRNLTMMPHTELLLYLARDAQMIDTVIRPALDRAAVVFADRYVFSAMALTHARGDVKPDDIERVVQVVARGLMPDHVIYCDVDIDTSNVRKRLSRVVKPREPDDFGRKGLRGLGLRNAMRSWYLEYAEQHRDTWFVVDNAQGSIERNAAQIVDYLLGKMGRTPPSRKTTYRAPVAYEPSPIEPARTAEIRRGFYQYLERLIDDGQSRLAGYHLRSLDSPESWSLRRRLVDDEPEVVALGLGPLSSEQALELRWKLVKTAPLQVARSLGALWADDHPEAWKLRFRLADGQPGEVAATLGTLVGDQAWELREALVDRVGGVVLSSLKTLDDDRAWKLRDRLKAKKYDWGLLEGLAGLDTGRAWDARRKRLKRSLPWVLLGLSGCESDEAWQLRRRYFDQATKLIIRSLKFSFGDEAWTMRRAAGRWAKESLTTIKNVDSEQAWALRRDLDDIWPVFAAKSVGLTLAGTSHGYAYLFELAAKRAQDPLVLHYLVKAIEARDRPLAAESQ